MVLDNLNTHTPAAFYLAFEPEEARRLVNRFEFHFTPKHGSWLNMAEIELSVLSRQCINQRIPDNQTLCHQVHAWEQDRN
ncbi:MAG: IS630 family transposase, partial [Gammaproteobacteria bacterium]|nr:IS630 family transposase [Gammaproteobacteria bacterium]NIW11164.1 IS630 family transposase [Gammaproteobacteria bacterium]